MILLELAPVHSLFRTIVAITNKIQPKTRDSATIGYLMSEYCLSVAGYLLPYLLAQQWHHTSSENPFLQQWSKNKISIQHTCVPTTRCIKRAVSFYNTKHKHPSICHTGEQEWNEKSILQSMRLKPQLHHASLILHRHHNPIAHAIHSQKHHLLCLLANRTCL